MKRDYRMGYRFLHNAIVEGLGILQSYQEDGIFQDQLASVIGYFEGRLKGVEKMFLMTADMPAWQKDSRYLSIRKFPLERLSLCNLLYRLRKERQISLKRAAEELGVSVYRYQKYEAGEADPEPEERKQLARLFEAEEELLDRAKN